MSCCTEHNQALNDEAKGRESARAEAEASNPPLEVTATLREWQLSDNVLWGRVYNDKKKRFRNGDYIYTSQIVAAPIKLLPGSIVQTKNSVYKLE